VGREVNNAASIATRTCCGPTVGRLTAARARKNQYFSLAGRKQGASNGRPTDRSGIAVSA
jgi:hypothetical protein